MTNFIEELQLAVDTSKANMPFLLHLIGVLWAIHLVNRLLGFRLNVFGILPRNIFGIFGIATSPFLHGHSSHLLLNCIPLFILGNFLLMEGREIFYQVSTIIIIISGLLTWAMGRHALHVGSSGVIMGYFGYLLLNAILVKTAFTLVIFVMILYSFGTLFVSMLPGEKNISFESHIFGFLAGLSAVYLVPYLSNINI